MGLNLATLLAPEGITVNVVGYFIPLRVALAQSLTSFTRFLQP
jgi:hypothetical protein